MFFKTDSLIIILHLSFDVSSTNVCHYFVTGVCIPDLQESSRKNIMFHFFNKDFLVFL